MDNKSCRCGCGKPTQRRFKYATPACRWAASYQRKCDRQRKNEERFLRDAKSLLRELGLDKCRCPKCGEIFFPPGKPGRPKGSRNKPKPPNVAGRDQ